MKRYRRGSRACWLAAALLAAALAGHAATEAPPAATVPGDTAAERQRIAADKRAVEQRYQSARRDCENRFAVSSCLDEARSERRRALEQLSAQQAVLDEAQRRRRAAERLQGIREKAREADARAAAPAASSPPRPPRTLLAPRRPAASVPVDPASSPRASPAPEQADQRRAERQQLEREAAAHKDAVLRRNAERDARKPPAAPLPVPPASATR